MVVALSVRDAVACIMRLFYDTKYVVAWLSFQAQSQTPYIYDKEECLAYTCGNNKTFLEHF